LIRDWCAGFHAYAKEATAHLADPGVLQVDWLDPSKLRPRTMYSARFKIGDHKSMSDCAIARAAEGQNVYVEARTIKRGTPGRGETAWVLALVIDYDGEGKAPIPESFSVQTSPGHAHLWCLTSLDPMDGKRFGDRLREQAGADDDTGVVSQPYIFPGTPNRPTFEKISEGRRTTIAETFIWTRGGPTYSSEDFERLLPAAPRSAVQPVVFDDPPGCSADQIMERMYVKAKMADKLFIMPTRGRDRSADFSRACWIAFSAGFTPSEVERYVLAHARNGCASKWIERGKLREQLESQWRDWCRRSAA
jgi:hypothetical protein